MRVIDQYDNHHYEGEWDKVDDTFCPSCGKQEIWNESGPGDYYVGSTYLCTACGSEHYLDHSDSKGKASILKQLRTGITDKPLPQPEKPIDPFEEVRRACFDLVTQLFLFRLSHA